MLPKKKSEKIVDLSKQVLMVYGEPKIGKSTLCSQFEKPLFIATEPGLNHLEVFKVNCNSWDKFREACGEIAKGDHDFKTIVIDTIDNLVMYCTEYVCQRERINHPSDYDYGKGWSMVTQELKRVLNKLSLLPYGLVLVGHARREEVKTKSKSYNKTTLSITGENRRSVLGLVDIILYISQVERDDKEIRIIHTKPSLYHEAGDRSNLLPEQLPLSYEELKKYFKGEEK